MKLEELIEREQNRDPREHPFFSPYDLAALMDISKRLQRLERFMEEMVRWQSEVNIANLPAGYLPNLDFAPTSTSVTTPPALAEQGKE